MPAPIRIPQAGLTMESATLVGWLKPGGASVRAGEAVAEIATDKATLEVEAPADGVLQTVAVPDVDLPVGGLLGYVLSAAEAAAGAAAGPPPAPAPSAPTRPAAEPAGTAPAAVPDATPGGAPDPRGGPHPVRATPAARRAARQHGVDLATVRGSGPAGRIHEGDVLAALAGRPAATAGAAAPATPAPLPGAAANGDGDWVPLNYLRRTIATRMAESKRNAPHVYLFVDTDMSVAEALRLGWNRGAGRHVTVTDLLVLAAARALRVCPWANASFREDAIYRHREVNVGVAVALEDGLVVPVIRGADRMTLAGVSAAIRDLADRARTRRLQPDEVSGSTFSVSNLGMYGIDAFTPIINPPEGAILGAGRVVDRPVVRDGRVVARPILTLCLSFDHRLMDGAQGARFLQSIVEGLETPKLLSVADRD